MWISPLFRHLCCGGAVAALSVPAAAAVVDVLFESPTLDRWMYPFNATPGTRGEAAVFTSLDIPEFDEFDERDGQALLGFDTSLEVPVDLPLSDYTVTAARLTIMNEGDENFLFDPTYDSYRTYLDPADPEYLPDEDAGRPLIISGAGYRNQFVEEPFPENGPFDNIAGEAPRTRNVYPITYIAPGMAVDISNNVEDRFDVTPFAVAQIPGLLPGDPVPNRTDMEFVIDAEDPSIQAYLRAALQRGRLDLVISSLHFSEVFGSNTYPTLYMKENFAVPTSASPARLELTVQIGDQPPLPGDVDGNGVVDVQDLVLVIVNWGPCPELGPCTGDLDGNDFVDVSDLVEVIVNWGTGG